MLGQLTRIEREMDVFNLLSANSKVSWERNCTKSKSFLTLHFQFRYLFSYMHVMERHLHSITTC